MAAAGGQGLDNEEAADAMAAIDKEEFAEFLSKGLTPYNEGVLTKMQAVGRGMAARAAQRKQKDAATKLQASSLRLSTLRDPKTSPPLSPSPRRRRRSSQLFFSFEQLRAASPAAPDNTSPNNNPEATSSHASLYDTRPDDDDDDPLPSCLESLLQRLGASTSVDVLTCARHVSTPFVPPDDATDLVVPAVYVAVKRDHVQCLSDILAAAAGARRADSANWWPTNTFHPTTGVTPLQLSSSRGHVRLHVLPHVRNAPRTLHNALHHILTQYFAPYAPPVHDPRAASYAWSQSCLHCLLVPNAFAHSLRS